MTDEFRGVDSWAMEVPIDFTFIVDEETEELVIKIVLLEVTG